MSVLVVRYTVWWLGCCCFPRRTRQKLGSLSLEGDSNQDIFSFLPCYFGKDVFSDPSVGRSTGSNLIYISLGNQVETLEEIYIKFEPDERTVDGPLKTFLQNNMKAEENGNINKGKGLYPAFQPQYFQHLKCSLSMRVEEKIIKLLLIQHALRKEHSFTAE